MENYGHLILTRKEGETVEIATPSGVLEIMTGVMAPPWAHVTFSGRFVDEYPARTEWIGEGEKFREETPDGPVFFSVNRFIYTSNHTAKSVSVAIDAPRDWNIARGELVDRSAGE